LVQVEVFTLKRKRQEKSTFLESTYLFSSTNAVPNYHPTIYHHVELFPPQGKYVYPSVLSSRILDYKKIKHINIEDMIKIIN
jgi:hypothetical protein